MDIKTKFGPAAILMSKDGNTLGIVKRINIIVLEGPNAPQVEYVVVANGNNHIIKEKDAIQLIPTDAIPTYLAERDKATEKEKLTLVA